MTDQYIISSRRFFLSAAGAPRIKLILHVARGSAAGVLFSTFFSRIYASHLYNKIMAGAANDKKGARNFSRASRRRPTAKRQLERQSAEKIFLLSLSAPFGHYGMLHLAISVACKKLLAEKQFRRRHRRRLAPFSNINVSIPGIDGEKQTLPGWCRHSARPTFCHRTCKISAPKVA
jgi:hypothetical protein